MKRATRRPSELRAFDRIRCVTSRGLPSSAVVTSQLRHVSFDEGWEVYTRRGAASLVAVCLAAAPAQG